VPAQKKTSLRDLKVIIWSILRVEAEIAEYESKKVSKTDIADLPLSVSVATGGAV